MENKLLIGLDVSLTSTGICFRYKGRNEYLSISGKSCYSASKKLTANDIFDKNESAHVQMVNALKLVDNVSIVVTERESIAPPKSSSLCTWQRDHLLSINTYANILVDTIKSKIIEYNIPIHDVYLNLENYSYGSASDTLIQIVEFTCLIKDLLLFRNGGIIPLNNFFITPGPHIKILAGKGNFDKYQMLNSFKDNDSKDEVIENDDFRLFVRQNYEIVHKTLKNNKKEVLTPISDIIDAYFLSLHLERTHLRK